MSKKITFLDRVKMQGATQVKMKYLYGGKINSEKELTTFLTPDGFFQYGMHRIPLEDITGASLKHEEQAFEHMKSRLTVTRMALLGPLALAAPKRRIQKNTSVTKFLAIDFAEDGFDSTILFSGKDVNKMLNHIKKWLSENKPEIEDDPADISEVANDPLEQNLDPFVEVKKFKDLFDMGIITEEEFEIKKKELLGL